MKVRQDAWSEEDDLLLAETVLRHIREGSTQLRAFDEVGDTLNRTSAACGFRWNAVVRDIYEDAIKLAKKHRKDRKRQQANQAKPISYSTPQPQNRTQPMPQPQAAVEQVYIPENIPSPVQTNYVTEQEITMKDVIRFLQKMNGSGYQETILKQEVETLRHENKKLNDNIAELESHLGKLKEEHNVIEEDYQSIIQLMNRARRMALLEEESEEHHSPKFRMDKNGNLEKLAK